MFRTTLTLLLSAVSVIHMNALVAQGSARPVQEYPYVGEVYDDKPEYQVSVNLRGGDGINYKILRAITEGDELIVHSQRGDWVEVQIVPESGIKIPVWAKKDFFNVQDGKATCLKDRVVLRAGATTKSEPIGQLDHDQSLEFVEEKNSWLKVVAPEETRVWIHSRYVRFKKYYEESDLGNSDERLNKGQNLELDIESANSEAHELSSEVNDVVTQDEETIERSSLSSLEEDGDKEVVANNNEQEIQNDIPNDAGRIRKLFEKKLDELQGSTVRKLESVDKISAYREFTAAGRLVNSSKAQDDQVSYQLEIGDHVSYFLKEAEDEDHKKLVNLAFYADKDVGVVGRIIESKDGKRIIQVQEIVVLSSDN